MNTPQLVVATTHGRVRGADEGAIHAWRGIPFAAPPVGELRFRAPVPPRAWDDVLETVAFSPSPEQDDRPASSGGVGGTPVSEDCLTINVIRPSRPADGPRPVMVWVYGGAFVIGASNAYPGTQLVDRGDVVLVTFNYRVGPFGFLDLSRYSTPEAPFETNVGIRDQVAALEWVRDNIAAFGGDPDDVTLFGESAGAMSIVTLMCAPAARGLFHRAISQSGPPATVQEREKHAEMAEELVRHLGHGSTDATDVRAAAALLRSASAGDIRAAMAKLKRTDPAEQPGAVSLSPVVDGDVLPAQPLDMFRAGEQALVPMIIGTNQYEGRLFQLLARMDKVELLPTSEASLVRVLAHGDPAAREALFAAYEGFPSKQSTAQLGGDAVFWFPSVELADAHSAYAPTWSYRFDFASLRGRLLKVGATHGVEVGYVFGKQRAMKGLEALFSGGRAAVAVSDAMMALWFRFTRTGNPGAEWPAYDTATRQTLIIDRTSRVESDPHAARRRAWSAFAPANAERP